MKRDSTSDVYKTRRGKSMYHHRPFDIVDGGGHTCWVCLFPLNNNIAKLLSSLRLLLGSKNAAQKKWENVGAFKRLCIYRSLYHSFLFLASFSHAKRRMKEYKGTGSRQPIFSHRQRKKREKRTNEWKKAPSNNKREKKKSWVGLWLAESWTAIDYISQAKPFSS